ncbi:S8 family peptidase [Sphingomonas humi]|uniref:Peptidase S8/S53 domain-containing protein n=1 Tax=Sphingomonas humi TaxID=335630 RepID=A0ABP7RG87_9SPHN
MAKALLGSAATLAMLGLSACGGGGSGGGVVSTPAPPVSAAPTTPTTPTTPAPTPPPPTTTAVNYDTAEYQYSNAPVISKAIAAYNAGATGKGVKAAVIDSGINPDMAELAGRIDPASRDVTFSGRALADESGHGSAVAAVIAAARDGKEIHGMAFDATIIALRADNAGSCTTTTGDNPGCKFSDGSIARGVDAAVAAGARVINLSLGGSTPGTTLLNAMARAVDAGTVIVISAGNDGKDATKGMTADAFAAVPASNFPKNVIIAGSIGVRDSSGVLVSTDQLSDFSNRAGSSANNFLGALGTGVRTINNNEQTVRYSGTSFSAPTISGAVALLASAFPNLTGAQIVEILFRSADDLGDTGTDAIFGRGRLNVERAFQPIGTLSVAGSSTPASGTGSDAPPAAGDASGTGLGAVILDGYSRAFAVDLARTLRSAPRSEPLRRAITGTVRAGGVGAGPLSVMMTVAERNDGKGFLLTQNGVGPEDLRKARLVAGSAVAKIDRKTALAFGFAEGAKAMERRLSGVSAGSFLIARDVAGTPGFDAARGSSMALRRDLGFAGLTVSGETGEVVNEQRTRAFGSPYRWTAATLDRRLGRTWLSVGYGRLEEERSLLGGRMDSLLGGGGAATNFLDLEARRTLGSGWSAGVTARRGWTRFAGGSFTTGAYAADLAADGLLTSDDRFGLRLSQPLRIDSGGFAMSLPTSFDYASMNPGFSIVRSSLVPQGRELDAEMSYGRRFLGTGWISGNLFARRQPGHIAAASADKGAALRISLDF